MYHLFYVKSNYSLLQSLLTIDDIVSYHEKASLSFASICDDNMYGTMEFIQKCKAKKIQPIIGLELHFQEYDLVAIIQDYEGYLNAIKLSTLQNEKKLTLEAISLHQDHLFFVLPMVYVSFYQMLSFLTSLYLGYSTIEEEQQALAITDNVLFFPMCCYLEEKDVSFLQYLFLIRDNKTITATYDLHQLFPLSLDNVSLDGFKTLDTTNTLAKCCHLELPEATLLLPIYTCPRGLDTITYLDQLAEAGLYKRLNGQISKLYHDRLIYELSVIHQMGFSNYFLVVYDFIRYAKTHHILVGPGRGSAAGSLVAYSLGITDIDPIAYDLLFERFLNPERVSMPDIDTDLPDIARADVIHYVIEKYGKKRVAGIVTFSTLAAKQVLRDVGKTLMIPSYKIDKLLSFIPAVNHDSLEVLYQDNISFREFILHDESLKTLYTVARRLEGFPRQIGTHAAGIVMCQKDLDEVVPLTVSDGMYLTSYSMNYLEQLGLLKMDFLGIKNLSMIMNILQDIETYQGISLSFSKIPLDDKETYQLFAKAKTSGIFQFESAGMRRFLQQLKPQNFEDIIASIALFRPGPAQNIPTYIARKENKEPITYFDPCLENILKKTYGIMIYQEQIMQVANVYAGYTLGEADILRRAISKKKKDILEQQRMTFQEKAKALHRDPKVTETLFAMILKFAGYGFNRSHAVAYSMVAYKMAYLKVHYKQEFYIQLLNNVIGTYEKTENYLKEIRQANIYVLKPDINYSNDRYSIFNHSILFPFSSIKGIGVSVCKTILAARKDKVFQSIFEAFSCLVRENVTQNQLERLTLAGCFDCFGYSKKTIMSQMDVLLNYAMLTKDLDPSLVLLPELTPMEEYDQMTLLEQEKNSFGFYIQNHPTTMFQKDYPNTVLLSQIEHYYQKVISTLILVEKIKVITTKKGEEMAFVSGSDETRSIDFTLFPTCYAKYKNLQTGMICLVTGTVEKRLDQSQIIVQKITILKGDKVNEE